MKIHIIRHTESEANTKHILAGQLDFPLTLKGKKDAEAIASWYTSHFTPKTIYCSPLLRAKQTAAPFRVSKALPFIEDERLKEHNLGVFQGKTYKEVESDSTYQQDRSKRWNWNITHGESYKDIAKRTTSFFEDLNPNDPDILIVTHAVAMRLMRGLLENTLPIYPEQLAKNGEIWEIDFK
jgi:broad specificity phosphatase PhoE